MKTQAEMLTGVVKAAIVKPLGDVTWEQFGSLLRALRAPLHRVLNGVVRELEVPHYDREDWWADPKDAAGLASPRTAAYRIAGTVWREECEAAAERVARKKEYPLDRVIAEHRPSSAAQLGAASIAFTRWKKFDKDRWRGETSLPSFKKESPIYLFNAGVQLRAEDGQYIASLALSGERIEVVLGVDGGHEHAKIAKILSGAARSGDGKIILVTDRHSKKPKWMLYLSMSWPAPERQEGRTMALHRGIKSFLSCAIQRSDTGAKDAFSAILETGEDLLRHKEAYSARRRSLGKQLRQLGAGARAHGKGRRYEAVTRIEDAEARWIRSKCQEVAAHACRLGEHKGVTRLLLEDWTNPARDGAPHLGEHIEYVIRSFPFAQLRESIEWAAKKRGWVVEIVKTDYNSRDCPNCGHRHDAAQVDTFRCANCMLERNVDIIFAWNMLARDGKTPGIEEAKQATKRVRGRMRPGKESNKTSGATAGPEREGSGP